jgi:hypothetical protein
VKSHLVTGIMLLVVLGTQRVCAQEMNYNTLQVGSRSALMGGAVVAGVRDTSATFYNPGALGFVENPSISVSANAFRLSKLSIEHAVGTSQDATTTQVEAIPLILSGMLRFHAAPQWAFGYAIVTRQQVAENFSRALDTQRETITFPGGAVFPGPADVLAQVNVSSQVNELWAMGAAAWRINETLALGLAPIVAWHRETHLDRFSLHPIPLVAQGGPLLIGENTTTDIDFYQFSVLARIGVAWEPSATVKLGATVTTPNLKIVGRGDARAEVTFNSPTPNSDRFGSASQDGVATHYRTPLSVAVGAEIKPWSPVAVGIAVAYSTALGRQALLEIQRGHPFFQGPGVIPGDAEPFLTPLDVRRAVVNVSFGTEYLVNDTYAAYLGFWTDFSPLDRQQTRDILSNARGLVLPTTDVDLYHIVFGAARTTTRSKIAAGVVLSHGTGTSQSGLEITATGDILGLTPGSSLIERHVSFSSLSFVLGYTYFF